MSWLVERVELSQTIIDLLLEKFRRDLQVFRAYIDPANLKKPVYPQRGIL
jgi:hypothetical protein